MRISTGISSLVCTAEYLKFPPPSEQRCTMRYSSKPDNEKSTLENCAELWTTSTYSIISGSDKTAGEMQPLRHLFFEFRGRSLFAGRNQGLFAVWSN